MRSFTKFPKTNRRVLAARYDSDRINFDADGEYRIKGLSANALSFIDDILGQLSDGYWENSPRMENYWPFATVEGNDFIIRRYNRYYSGDRHRYCGFADMSESHIKRWFADKIKQLTKEDCGEWSRDSETPLDWLHGTVAEAYAAYDELYGR